MNPSPDRVTLYFREGSSDKVYQAAIEPAGARFVVNIAYGRRGSTLTTGTKTNIPVDYPKAKAVFDKVIKEKTSKGYTPGEDGTPYAHGDSTVKATRHLPQLLNPIEEPQLESLLGDDSWCLQEKFDGRRLLVEKTGGDILGINRKGLVTGLPQAVLQSAGLFPVDFVIDGECVGDHLYVFDILELDGRNLRPLPFEQRLLALCNLLASAQCQHVSLVQSLRKATEKRRRLEEIRRARGEGVVFKRLSAPYTPGRPNTGGTALKFKFTATLTALVSAVNEKRSVQMWLSQDGDWRNAGNVTIPANHSIPKAGDVIEVRYLYAFPESGVLFQPVYLGVRDDMDAGDCTTMQLKFKAASEEA